MAADEEARATDTGAAYAMLKAMSDAQGTIQKELSGMDEVVTKGAAGIGQSGPDGEKALVILSGMSGAGPAAIDAITVDLNGTILAVQPDQYKSVKGADIHNQTHIERLYEQKIPVMSDLFMTAEGFPAVDIASPVFSPGGKFIGATTLLFSPGTLIGRDIPKMDSGAPWDVFVLQKDGTVLYAPDGELTGKHIFGDPRFTKYPDLVHFSDTITTDWQGNESYTFTDEHGNMITKHIIWTTVGIRGAEWRLVFSGISNQPPSDH